MYILNNNNKIFVYVFFILPLQISFFQIEDWVELNVILQLFYPAELIKVFFRFLKKYKHK